MLNWTDADGRKWSTRLEIPQARALRDAGFDIRDVKSLQRFLGDPEQLLDFAVEYFRPQWSKHADVIENDVAFMVILTATDTSLAEAHAAMVAGILDFFRRTGEAKRVAVVESVLRVIETENQRMIAKLQGPEVDAAASRLLDSIEKEFDKQLADAAIDFGETFTKSSANAESQTAERG